MPAKLKTSIKDILVANDEIIEKTARAAQTTKAMVNSIIGFTGKYIHNIIKGGTMESVLLPYFGTFKPKPEKVYHKQRRTMNRRNKQNIIEAALQGKDITYLNDDNNETFRNRRSNTNSSTQ